MFIYANSFQARPFDRLLHVSCVSVMFEQRKAINKLSKILNQ